MNIVETALARARRRLLPFLFLLYVVSYLDRINVGFAALQMNAALGFSSVTYSLGVLAGWQWLFVVEGLPATVLGIVVLRALPEQPSDARWLTPAQQEALTSRLAEDAASVSGVHSIRGALTSGRVWLLAAVYFT